VGSSNNILAGNNASYNDGYGICIDLVSINNRLTNNTASYNEDGICLSSSNNILYHNNLIDNTDHNAHDQCTNQWDSGSEGNYYSDYTGTDNDTDGIGDTPYPIPGDDSVDRYPLMQPYSPPTGHQNKSLVQVGGQPEVYWLQNGRLYWVTDWNVINNMSGVRAGTA
jgi:parallel beta-helix repeat protein